MLPVVTVWLMTNRHSRHAPTPAYRPRRTWTPGHCPERPPVLEVMAWAAGIFEARGSIGRDALLTRVANEGIAERLHESIGGSLNGPYGEPNQYWVWTLTGARGRWFAAEIRQLLSDTKIERLEFFGWFKAPARAGRPLWAPRVSSP